MNRDSRSGGEGVGSIGAVFSAIVFGTCCMIALAACVPSMVKNTSAVTNTSTVPRAIFEAPADHRQLVLSVQLMLREKGFDPGPIDGIDGSLTKAALREFQDSRGLRATDYVNDEAYYQLANDGQVEWQSRGYSSASQRMRADSEFASPQSYLQACVVGAIPGVILGQVTAKNKEEAKKRMAVGAGVGCIAAMGANYWLQGKRQRAVYQEAEMNQMLAALQDENRRLTSLVQSSKEVVAEDRRRIREIDAAYRNKQVSLEAARRQMAEVDDNRAHLERTLANLEQRQRDWQELGSKLRSNQSGSQVVAIEREIRSLERKVEMLKGELSSLEQIRRVSVIG